MKKTLKRVFAAVMAAAMLPIISFNVASAAQTPLLAANETFNAYITNDQPTEVDIKARNWYITEYADKEKGLLMYASLMGSSYTVPAASTTDTVISFDMRATDVMPTGEVKVYDSKGMSQTLLKFTAGRGAGAYNGLPLSGFGKSRSINYAIVYRADEDTCDIYVNGKAKVTDMNIKAAKASNVASVEFAFSSTKDAQGVIIDNVNIYSSDKYIKADYPVAEYNEEAYEEMEVSFGPQVGSATLVNENFDSGSTSLNVHVNQNDLKVVTDTENPENKVFKFERLGEGDSHFNANGIASESDYVVYEFDLRVHEKMSVMSITFKDSNAVFSGPARLKSGYSFESTSGYQKNLKPGQWYRISIINDYYTRKHNVYLDKQLVSTVDFSEKFMTNGAALDVWRLHMTHGVGGVTASDPIHYEIDNFRVYESDKIVDELGQIEKNIDITSKRTVFTSDAAQKKMLVGYSGFHGTSGVVLKDGKKTILQPGTYIKDDTVAMMPAEALGEALGVNVAVNGASVQFNGRAINGEIKDGVAYIPAPEAANALGKAVTHLPATYNAHAYIVGSTSFPVPLDQPDIDALNDYLLYWRPSMDEFKELYNSSELAGVHPRIQFTQADFDNMAALCETDKWMKTWKDRLISTCENYLEADLLKHERYDGLRMNCQRMLSKRIHALAVCYHLTKDQRFLDRAYLELETVALFPDWNPGHHLDTCEMMAAFAVGYDWLYNFFTPEQREVLEKGILSNGFYDSVLAFQTPNTAMGSCFYATNNHGNVDNTGALMAALAFMDVHPDVSAYMAVNSLRGAELCMYKWAPEGVWYEGAGYWELTMQFTAKWLDTLTTMFPTTAGLGMHNLEGMGKAAMAELQSQTPLGVYNFADAMPQRVLVPEMLYLANAYDIDGVYSACIEALNGKWVDDEDLGLAMMWYEPERMNAQVELPLDYTLTRIDTIMMRNSWDTQEPTVVGIHGGKVESGHDQLDTGSFIYETGGIRWSMDMGMGEYNSLGYWEAVVGGRRWNHYRSRAESHSTIFTSPDKREDHQVNNHGKLTVVTQKPRGAIATMDMSNTLWDVSAATRGFAFTDNRESLVIRDEITLTKTTDVVWTMITEASGEIVAGENKAILTQKGRELVVTWDSNADITATFEVAQALPTSPEQTDNFVPGRYNMLRLRSNTGGEFNLTVKLTPTTVNGGTTVADWNKSISEWTIPDGEIPPKPTLDYVVANGKQIATDGKTAIEATVVEGEFTTPPAVSASSDIYDVTVTQTDSFDKAAEILVVDRNDRNNRTLYTVYYSIIKQPITFPGMTSIPVRGYEVSEISQEANPPINMFDGTQVTRYAVSGTEQWAILDLGDSQKIDNVIISFMSGHIRRQKLAISVSDDGATWTTMWDGMSCGTTEDFETFPITGAKGRYIKFDLKGNTAGGENWNSLTEVVITRNNG